MDPVTILLRAVLVPLATAVALVFLLRARDAEASARRSARLALAAGLGAIAGAIAVPGEFVLLPAKSLDWTPHVLLAAVLAGLLSGDSGGAPGVSVRLRRWVLRGALAAFVAWVAAPRREPLVPFVAIAAVVLALCVVLDRLESSAEAPAAASPSAGRAVPSALGIAGLAAGLCAAGVFHGGLSVAAQMCGALAVAFGATALVGRAVRASADAPGSAGPLVPLAAAGPVLFAALGHTRGEVPAPAALVLALAPAAALVPAGFVVRVTATALTAAAGIALGVVLA